MTLLTESSPSAVRAIEWTGRAVPAHCTSAGRALLLDHDERSLGALLGDGELPAAGPGAPRDIGELARRIGAARALGYAAIDAEFEDGHVGVAAPVRNFSGRIVAALNVSAPAFRLGGRRLDAAGGEIRARAESSRAASDPAHQRRWRIHMADAPGLLERLDAGPVICAEGYLFELERRGYLQAGAFVPEVVLEHPEVVAQLHRDFVHAGSDVVEAFTYYAHREKLRVIGREHLLEAHQPAGARPSPRTSPRDRARCSPATSATRTSSPATTSTRQGGPRDVRGAGRLGGRRGRRLRHRRDVLVGARRR